VVKLIVLTASILPKAQQYSENLRLTDPALSPPARGHSWRLDALVGAAAALVALGAAHASLPEHPQVAAAARPHPAAAPQIAAAPEPAFTGLIAFVEPVPGRAINSPFGLRKLPWEEGGRLHEGVDFAAEPGESVLAAADGVIVRAGQDGGYGRFVEIRHAAGLSTLYAHLGAIGPAARPGQAVKAGQPVGAIGNSGSSTGPHLHFEVRDERDRPLNPAYFIGQSFQTAEDLPLSRAARVPRGVRIAYVSYIPESKRELMAEREVAKKSKTDPGSLLAVNLTVAAGERPRMRLDVGSVNTARVEERKALVARVAAAQRAEMAAEPASASVPAPPSQAPSSSAPAAALDAGGATS